MDTVVVLTVIEARISIPEGIPRELGPSGRNSLGQRTSRRRRKVVAVRRCGDEEANETVVFQVNGLHRSAVGRFGSIDWLAREGEEDATRVDWQESRRHDQV